MQTTDSVWTNDPIAPVERVSVWKLIVTLFKLRIVSLLLLSAAGGMILGVLAGGAASAAAFGLLMVTGTLSAAGASAINQYLERERDANMRRTHKRPLVNGQIQQPHWVLGVGGSMIVAAVTLALAAGNPPLAFWLLAGAAIYVGVYTVWLKPRSSLNIVIGGAAGSCAVLSGGAAAGNWAAPAVWLLAILIFVWTPVHFWALALAYRDDYANADFPMLPTQVSAPVAARWTVLHGGLTAVAGLALGLTPYVNIFYLVCIGLATLPLLKRMIDLLGRPEKKEGLRLFLYSNLYLAMVLVALIVSNVGRLMLR